MDIANADCIVIEGSNFAEAHPVGFQWVIEAKKRGARVIHVDPRFTRTSANADKYIHTRVGTDVVLMGAIINHILSNDLWFHEYVLNYTNATSVVCEDFRGPEDLEGLFSGYDPETGVYRTDTWAYQEEDGGLVSEPDGAHDDGALDVATSEPEQSGSGGPPLEHAVIRKDPTLQDPNCVLNLLKKHYARYTPEMVEEVCGVSPEDFWYLANSIIENSGRDRTTLFCYAVGLTQHTMGAQMIRSLCILQLLMGNVGRPGSGIMALRGHASIQGSTDIPTLFHLLPGYLPMPRAKDHQTLQEYVASIASPNQKGFWAYADNYAVSLLKAWWGEHATEENNFYFERMPKLTGAHGTYQTVMRMDEGGVGGYFLFGQNPAVASAHTRLQRRAMAKLDWMVVRDMVMTESAEFWRTSPEIETGELVTEDIATEVFFMPSANYAEKAGTFTQTQRMVQWRRKSVNPPGEADSDLQFVYDLGRRLRERLKDSTEERDRILLDLTWDYPLDEEGEIEPEAVLMEINGQHLTGEKAGQPLASFMEMKSDGSTSGGCWIYAGVYANGVNQADRKPPLKEGDDIGADWAWAWPANRRILYNRASADPQGRPWSERKALVWWDEDEEKWVGRDVPDFPVDKAPDFVAEPGVGGAPGLDGTDAFTMQADGLGWLFAPKGLVDGPMPAHYETPESGVVNAVYPIQVPPMRIRATRQDNMFTPPPDAPGSDVYPYVLTTNRLTEHYTSGGMTRTVPYLAELQPELFAEVSPALAAERGLEHGEFATIVSPRGAIEARVMVTERVTVMEVGGRTLHQIGLPYHWGVGTDAVVSGDAVNDLMGIMLDPNVNIQESKQAACDILPGRRPRGKELLDLVADYQQRAGLTPTSGWDAVERIDNTEVVEAIERREEANEAADGTVTSEGER